MGNRLGPQPSCGTSLCALGLGSGRTEGNALPVPQPHGPWVSPYAVGISTSFLSAPVSDTLLGESVQLELQGCCLGTRTQRALRLEPGVWPRGSRTPSIAGGGVEKLKKGRRSVASEGRRRHRGPVLLFFLLLLRRPFHPGSWAKLRLPPSCWANSHLGEKRGPREGVAEPEDAAVPLPGRCQQN